MTALFIVFGVIIAGFIWCAIDDYRFKQSLLILKEGRENDSICSFARSFDYRQIDTKAIRAVYESLQPYLRSKSKPFPIHREDRLLEDYGIDFEELEYIFIDDIGPSISRDFSNSESNPYFDRVKTVGDLVLFTHHQPSAR
ncbi:MAG: hypothetical protein P1U89_23140 [Verrucomicrobiales bacterium]|nr:hypothetical protein [Verrucomicrobiales bacterium]